MQGQEAGAGPWGQCQTNTFQTLPLFQVYDNIAESLPETSDLAGGVSEGLPLLLDSVDTTASLAGSDTKWLSPGTTLTELLDLAKVSLSDLCPPSYPTLARCYHSSWQKKLRIRAEGNHAKCSDCERFKQYRRQATAPEDARLVTQEYQNHLRSMMEDRRVDARMMVTAAQSLTPGSVAQSPLLSIQIDAMDTAKYRVPRNLAASKEFACLWRPELHLVGTITDGVE